MIQISRGEVSSLLIQEGYGAELATAPSPNNYEMIEKLGYLISLSRSAAPLAKEPLLLLLLLRFLLIVISVRIILILCRAQHFIEVAIEINTRLIGSLAQGVPAHGRHSFVLEPDVQSL